MPKRTAISGYTYLVTGTLTEFTRAEAEALVKDNGGTVISGVTSKLNYLVVGADAGSKLDKAKALGTVKILTEKEFLKLVQKGCLTAKKPAAKKSATKKAAVKQVAAKKVAAKQTEVASKSVFSAATFLFTGTLIEFTRAEAEALVKDNGGMVISGVTSKLNYLVVGADAGSKLDKARALGTVKILTEKDFLKMVPKGKLLEKKAAVQLDAARKTDLRHSADTKETSFNDVPDDLSDVLERIPDQLSGEKLRYSTYFPAICLGAADFDDVLSAITSDIEDEDEQERWGAWENDTDFDLGRITNESHRLMLRRGISFSELMKLYPPDDIIDDFTEMMNSSFGVMVYCKRSPVFKGNRLIKSWPTYILTVDDLPKLFDRFPETMINIVIISYSQS